MLFIIYRKHILLRIYVFLFTINMIGSVALLIRLFRGIIYVYSN